MKLTLQDNKRCELIREIASLIKGTKFENNVYLTGGSVRDIIIGNEKDSDIDLCVTMKDGALLFSEWITIETSCFSINNPLITERYGTIKFCLKSIHSLSNINVNCVSSKKSFYNKIDMGTIEEDSKTRDFTIDSLYMNVSTCELLDPTKKGIDDIQKKIIRANNPNLVFVEDPLRMLRAIRLSSELDFGIEKDTWLQIINNARYITKVSQEKITREVNKILVADKPSVGIRRMLNTELLGIVLPEVFKMIGVTQGYQHFGDVFAHTMCVLDKTKPILINRLSGLYHDIGKPKTVINIADKIHFFNHEIEGSKEVTNILGRMKYSSDIINKVSIAVKNHMKFKQQPDTPSKKCIRKFIEEVSAENVDLVLDVIDADNKSHAPGYCKLSQVDNIRDEIEDMNKKEKVIKPILSGNDIINIFGIKSGPTVGTLLDFVKDLTIKNPNITKLECVKELKKKLSV